MGARLPLIAFNVNLGTDRKEVADQIARCVRERNGGFKNVKAMGVVLEERRQVQVSMNLENYHDTPIYRVLEAIRREAGAMEYPWLVPRSWASFPSRPWWMWPLGTCSWRVSIPSRSWRIVCARGVVKWRWKSIS